MKDITEQENGWENWLTVHNSPHKDYPIKIIRNKTYLLPFTGRRLSLQDARIHGFNILYQQAKKLLIEAKDKLCRKEVKGEKSLYDIMA